MNSIFKHGSMDELKIKLRAKYPQLTDTDLQYKEGMEENMLRIIEYKLRMTKIEMQIIIEKL